MDCFLAEGRLAPFMGLDQFLYSQSSAVGSFQPTYPTELSYVQLIAVLMSFPVHIFIGDGNLKAMERWRFQECRTNAEERLDTLALGKHVCPPTS